MARKVVDAIVETLESAGAHRVHIGRPIRQPNGMTVGEENSTAQVGYDEPHSHALSVRKM